MILVSSNMMTLFQSGQQAYGSDADAKSPLVPRVPEAQGVQVCLISKEVLWRIESTERCRRLLLKSDRIITVCRLQNTWNARQQSTMQYQSWGSSVGVPTLHYVYPTRLTRQPII